MEPSTWTPPTRRTEALAELPMFAVAPPAPSVPVASSEAAADAVDSFAGRKRAATDRARLLLLVASRESGYTADEMEVATGIAGNTLRPRLRELFDAGLIEASETIVRPTRTGRSARVVFATTKGRATLARAA